MELNVVLLELLKEILFNKRLEDLKVDLHAAIVGGAG